MYKAGFLLLCVLMAGQCHDVLRGDEYREFIDSLEECVPESAIEGGVLLEVMRCFRNDWAGLRRELGIEFETWLEESGRRRRLLNWKGRLISCFCCSHAERVVIFRTRYLNGANRPSIIVLIYDRHRQEGVYRVVSIGSFSIPVKTSIDLSGTGGRNVKVSTTLQGPEVVQEVVFEGDFGRMELAMKSLTERAARFEEWLEASGFSQVLQIKRGFP